MTASSEASQALAHVRERILLAAQHVHRDAHVVQLLAVSKFQPAESIRALHAAGQRAFGENYVQEAQDKAIALADLTDIEWHLIGPLQSNKTAIVAQTMHWVHSLDRLKIAERLSAQRPKSLPALNVCIQVNISGEVSKSGVPLPDARSLAIEVGRLPNLSVRGLMTVPQADIGEQETRRQFDLLAHCFDNLKRVVNTCDTLSIGMSADLEIAIACGSTMVRVGTALFGLRPAKGKALK